MIKDYIIQNWALVLVLFAFTVSLKMTVFLDKRTIRRMLVMIVAVFLLSVSVFTEFRLADSGAHQGLRLALMAVRYSSTPFLLAMIIFTLVRRYRWFVFIPAMAMAVVNIVSIFNGVVFSLDESHELVRGPLGYFPYVTAGFYCVFVIYVLYKRSNKTAAELIPIAFYCFAFISDLVLPFVIGRYFSQLFCVTISIALFVYYVFSILQLTKKDALTGALNRQAYYADVADEPEEITALVSMDMNGLKIINDTEGHAAGDEALTTLAVCFARALGRRQSLYRVGGDEFVIVCRRVPHLEVAQLVERIEKNVADTKYSCSIGYSYSIDGSKPIDTLLKESDNMMYEEKARYHKALDLEPKKKR
ncbi:MAG: GGDEF domain-containing protein [Clostridia bacterium]|nr:GGDEF domain-containing protein [Clostridia bacterium]